MEGIFIVIYLKLVYILFDPFIVTRVEPWLVFLFKENIQHI